MRTYIQSSILRCQEPKTLFFGQWKTGFPLLKQALRMPMVWTLGRRISALTIKTGMQSEGSEHTACLDWEESLSRQQWERGPREQRGACLGRWGKVLKSMNKEFFTTSSHFPCVPKFLLLLCFSALWKALWGRTEKWKATAVSVQKERRRRGGNYQEEIK